MTPDDMEQLRRLALAALEGDGSWFDAAELAEHLQRIDITVTPVVDANLIATLTPKRVIEILDALERAEALAERTMRPLDGGNYKPERVEQAVSAEAPEISDGSRGRPQTVAIGVALPNVGDDVRTGTPHQAATPPGGSTTLMQRLENMEKHQDNEGNEYGAEVLFHARKAIENAEARARRSEAVLREIVEWWESAGYNPGALYTEARAVLVAHAHGAQLSEHGITDTGGETT